MTAPTAIVYNSTTAQFGIMTAELITKMRDAQALSERIYAAALEVTAGDTPANLEAAGSGFEVETGQGGGFMTYLGSINTVLNGGSLPGYLAKIDRGG